MEALLLAAVAIVGRDGAGEWYEVWAGGQCLVLGLSPPLRSGILWFLQIGAMVVVGSVHTYGTDLASSAIDQVLDDLDPRWIEIAPSRPSALTATARTSSAWPVSTWGLAVPARSHTRTVPSKPALTAVVRPR